MDVLMSVIFFIMFLIVIGIVIYLVYDYMEYKDNVDVAFDISTKHINDNFEKVSEDMDKTELKIDDTDKLARSVDVKAYNIDSKLKSTQKAFNQFQAGYRDNIRDINHNFQLTQNNDGILNNWVQSNKKSLDNFDEALKKYFLFSENGQSISNEKIFNHVFSDVNPNLELLSQVQTVSGVTIKTPLNKIDTKNFRICNSQNNCINMNVDNDGFNLTPENVSNLTIHSQSNKPLAKFDLKNESIYFGGSDINSPMFIQNSNLYVNELNLIVKPHGTMYNTTDVASAANLSVASINGQDLYDFSTVVSNFISENSNVIMQTINAYDGRFANLSTIDSVINATKQCFVKYRLINQTINSRIISSISIEIYGINIDLKQTDNIMFDVSTQEIGALKRDYATNYSFSSDNTYIDYRYSFIRPKPNSDSITFTIKLSQDYPKQSESLRTTITGDFLEPTEISTNAPIFSGMTIGKIISS